MLGASLLGRFLAVLLAVLGVGRLGAGVIFWRAANKLERPSYEVLKTIGDNVQLRRYDPYLIAETEVADAGMREGTGKGFGVVAGYIFGKNKPKSKMAMTAPVRIASERPTPAKGEKMAMTAPVRSETGGRTGSTKVSFVIGSKYTLRTAPTPMDRSVRVRNVAPHLLAARTFSGPPPSEKRVARERAKILAAMDENGLRPADKETLVYGYHDPFMTPGFLRRNEVCIRVIEV